MGLLDGMLGNAAKIDPAKIQQKFSQILAKGEVVEHAYQLICDYFVFTDKRLVLVDKQGMTGSKIDYHSIPYKSITQTGGTFDLDAELKIWIARRQRLRSAKSESSSRPPNLPPSLLCERSRAG